MSLGMHRIEFGFEKHDGATLDAAELRKRLAAEGLNPYSWSNGPGVHYDWHTHAENQILVCAQGSITMTVALDAEQRVECVMEPGDRLDLPAGTQHSADVGPDGVTMLEAAVN